MAYVICKSNSNFSISLAIELNCGIGKFRRAFAAGVYLVNDKNKLGVDVVHMNLAETLPGLFDASELDGRTMLERIVEVAEEGKEKKVSLAEYSKMLADQHYITEDEFLLEMELSFHA